jgi:hypothetical protein
MSPPDRTNSDETIKTAFLIIAGGGTGWNGARRFRQYAPRCLASPFPHHLISIDTDKSNMADDRNGRQTDDRNGRRASLLEDVDEHVNIALTRDDVSVITANPERFGPAAAELVTKRKHLLVPEALEYGSRTTRMITQLATVRHRDRISAALEAGCSRLAASEGIRAIQPVVMGSGGGGCGSALLPLMTLILTDPKCQQAFAPNLADKIQKPILLVAEPYAFASANTDETRRMILANAFATRLEISLLSRAQRVFLALRLGHGNDHGTRFDQLPDVYTALGAMAFMIASEFGYLIARGVDTFLKGLHTKRYNGSDVPESIFPAGLQPPYAARPPRRRPQSDVPRIDLSFRGMAVPLPSPGLHHQNGFTKNK